MDRNGRFAAMLVGMAAVAAGLAIGAGQGGHVAGSRAVAATRLATASGWGNATEVPGLGAINKARIDFTGAMSTSLSCGGPGNCSAGGSFVDGAGHTRAFLVSQARGHWGDAIAISPPSNGGESGFFQINSVSCASAGNCGAGGIYTDRARRAQSFLINQVKGRWGKAIEVPGIAKLNSGHNADFAKVSCASAGNCAATGTYLAGQGQGRQVFVVSEVRGVWGKATELPGIAALDHGESEVGALSCPAAGACALGGVYRDAQDNDQGFVASQVRGRWQAAIEVPGLAALNQQGAASVGAISCATPGNCGAGGFYADSNQASQAYVVSEVRGHWGQAIEVPGTARLNTAGTAEIAAISCVSPGNCEAAGEYDNGSQSGDFTNGEAFVVSQVAGIWHTAAELPGIGGLNKGDDASIGSISCPAAGDCDAAGQFASGTQEGRPDFYQAFVASEVHGVWHAAIVVPGLARLNKRREADAAAVSCVSASHCVVTGFYTDGRFHFQAFIDSQR